MWCLFIIIEFCSDVWFSVFSGGGISYGVLRLSHNLIQENKFLIIWNETSFSFPFKKDIYVSG